MNWLEAHQAAIQAITAIVTALTTITLAVLTGVYVSLTRQQTRHIVKGREVRERQAALATAALAERLANPLVELDGVGPTHGRARDYAHLSESDVGSLETHAQSVNDEAIVLAASAAKDLRVILGFIAKTRSVPPQTGWMASDREVAQWNASVQGARKSLIAVAGACRDLAPSQSITLPGA